MRNPGKPYWALLLTVLCVAATSFGQGAPPNPGLNNVFNAAPAGTFSGGVGSIAIAVHGFDSDGTAWGNAFLAADTAQTANTWDTWAFDWSQDAAPIGGAITPVQLNIVNAQLQGQYLAKTILDLGNKSSVHLYGHSLGGRVIETAATILSQATNAPTVQTTFLDPYTPYSWDLIYGKTSTWSDEIVNTNDYPQTNSYLPNALDVDVTAAGPGNFFNTNTYSAAHSWPYQWYQASITNFNAANPTYAGLGYNLSLEQANGLWPGGNPARGTVDVMNKAGTGIASTSTYAKSLNLNQQTTNPNAVGVFLTKSSDNVTVADNLITMNAADTGVPEWINLAFNPLATVNFIDFTYNFSTTLDGTLSVFLDNKLLWAGMDQFALTNQFEDPGLISFNPVAPGQHILSFRLDAGSLDAASDVQIKNLSMGLVTLPEPASIGVLTSTVILMLRRPVRGKKIFTSATSPLV